MLASWIRRHRLLGYFALAFGISWLGILILLVTSGFEPGELPLWETGVIFVLMLLGPSMSGLALTALSRGWLMQRPRRPRKKEAAT